MSNDVNSYCAVLFDFDGTLADSYQAITSSVNHVRARHGSPPLSVAEVRQHVGRGPDYLLAHTVPGYEQAIDLPLYRSHHPTVMFEGTHLLPGAAEAVTALHRAGKRVGLCSNKPRAFSVALLAHFGLGPCFALILGPEDVARPKPAPDMLLTALHRLQLAADGVLYVGDMTVDVQTARAAGVCVWTVPTGSDDLAALEAARPDRLLADLHELAACLTADNAGQ